MSDPTRSDDEIDDPGRDPKGLDPPRNVLFSSPQDTGQGEHGHGNVGPADKPEPPTEEPESQAEDSDEPDESDKSGDA